MDEKAENFILQTKMKIISQIWKILTITSKIINYECYLP